MSKYLEVIVRIPIREEHQDNKQTLNQITSGISIHEIPNIPGSCELSFENTEINEFLVMSLAHVKAAEVRVIKPGKGYIDEKISDEPPYLTIGLEPMNIEDARQWLDNEEMDALVEEESAGIIGYIHKEHIDKVVQRLNGAAD